MAEYFKFRLTAAKVGVSMAFFALLAGLAEKVKPSPNVTAEPAASFLAQTPAEGSAQAASLKVSLGSLEQKLSSAYYTSHKINQTFLKIKSANTEFLKIKSANTEFLKIDEANSQFVKINDANTQFLHGDGSVLTNALTVATSSSPQTLLSMSTSQGLIIVVCEPHVGGGVDLILQNNTQSTLPAVQDVVGQDEPKSLPPGNTTLATITGQAQQLHLQTFPAGGVTNVLTLTISGEPSGDKVAIVGQAINGDG